MCVLVCDVVLVSAPSQLLSLADMELPALKDEMQARGQKLATTGEVEKGQKPATAGKGELVERLTLLPARSAHSWLPRRGMAARARESVALRGENITDRGWQRRAHRAAALFLLMLPSSRCHTGKTRAAGILLRPK